MSIFATMATNLDDAAERAKAAAAAKVWIGRSDKFIGRRWHDDRGQDGRLFQVFDHDREFWMPVIASAVSVRSELL